MKKTAYENLVELGRELQLVGDAQALLSWDQEVLLPPKGVAYRAEQMSWFSGWIHERYTEPKVGDWIGAAEAEAETLLERANLREWRHRYERATRLPKRLVEDFAETQVRAKAVWGEAREKDDFSLFAPALEKLVGLCRQQAELWEYEEHPYDALLDKFERGASTRQLTETLGALRTRLIPVVEAATSREPVDEGCFRGHYPIEKQAAFNREVAESIGFDFEAGRIDTAVHPFCSGMAPRDTRLTTRYDEADFRSSLFGVLHEAGHGLYEQGLIEEHRGQPIGNAVSLGIHESQSRLWENHVGRSRAFWEKWLPRAVDYFPHLSMLSAERVYQGVNQAKPSYIRVEADEVTYDLHVLLRFELEKAIFSDELEIGEIPGEWNRRFEDYFGLPVKSDTVGCLQDIHWSMGIFGYFPTYSLGNINAAHLARTAFEQDPSIPVEMEKADYSGLLRWMRENIHEKGSVFLPDDLMLEAAGGPADSRALIEHLTERYLRP
ncbi:MAG: carboxypeptidase M32 [Verrucomicrobiales bacterium]